MDMRFGVVLAVLAVVRTAAEITLTTSPESNIKQGDDVKFTCTIPKAQKSFSDLIRFVREYDSSRFTLSTNNQIDSVFSSKKGYSIVYDDTSSANGDIIVTFTMKGIQGEDGGNIGCFLIKGNGDDKSIGKMVDVIVNVPVKDVTLSLDGGDAIADGGKLTTTSGGKAAVCVVSVAGSDLAPTVTLKVGDTDVTKEATSTPASKRAATSSGLLVLSYTQTLKYTPKEADNGKTLTCSAKPSQFDAVSKSVILDIQTAPVLECTEKNSAKVGDENVVLSCKVTGNPLPTAGTWSWSHNGQQKTQAAVIKNEAGAATVTLTLPKLDKDSFHGYTLNLGNGVGQSEAEVTLSETSVVTTAPTATPSTKPTPKPTYKHVTDPVKEEPKSGQSTSGANGLSSVPFMSATFASIVSIIIACLL